MTVFSLSSSPKSNPYTTLVGLQQLSLRNIMLSEQFFYFNNLLLLFTVTLLLLEYFKVAVLYILFMTCYFLGVDVSAS